MTYRFIKEDEDGTIDILDTTSVTWPQLLNTFFQFLWACGYVPYYLTGTDLLNNESGHWVTHMDISEDTDNASTE